MTPTLLDLALKAGFSDPIEGWMGEAYEERLEAFAKLIIEHEAAKQPDDEPMAFDFQKALRRAYHLGQNYWADADSESYSSKWAYEMSDAMLKARDA